MFGHKHMLSREGGVEIVVKELATRMSARGHYVVCYDRKNKHVSGEKIQRVNEYKGVRIINVWTLKLKGLAAVTSSWSSAIHAIRSHADIVHIHAEGPAAVTGMIKLLGKSKDGNPMRVIVTIHGLDWARSKWGGFASKYIKYGEKQAVKNADEIIVLSRSVQEYFQREYGRNTHFIPNGVNAPALVPANEIKRLWGLEKDGYVLFLGRIVPEKGLRYLVEAWKDVKTDKKLVIAGGSSDTQSFSLELQKMADDDSIVFTGFQQGRILEELYSNSYIYCLPSDLEGMPLSLLEAMSYGNCCLVSDIPECTEVIGDRAAVFKKSNVEDLRLVLQQLIDNPERVMAYKNTASDYIISKYNWDEVAEKTLKLYKGQVLND
ncbi:MAG: glycosyltransferase family 4 protein [Saccharofermentans sp.]|nr:glycosyltransferase family 4 protein [Saccharofermentans sp.]